MSPGECLHMLGLMKDLKCCKDGYLRHKDMWSSSQLKAQWWFTDGKLQKILCWIMSECSSLQCQPRKYGSDKDNNGIIFSPEELFLWKMNSSTNWDTQTSNLKSYGKCIYLNSQMYRTMWWRKQSNNHCQKESWTHEGKWMQFSV